MALHEPSLSYIQKNLILLRTTEILARRIAKLLYPQNPQPNWAPIQNEAFEQAQAEFLLRHPNDDFPPKETKVY